MISYPSIFYLTSTTDYLWAVLSYALFDEVRAVCSHHGQPGLLNTIGYIGLALV